MSATVKLNSSDLTNLARALDIFSGATRTTGVRIDSYAPIQLRIGDNTIECRWDTDSDQYVLEDQVGS